MTNATITGRRAAKRQNLAGQIKAAWARRQRRANKTAARYAGWATTTEWKD